MSAEKKIVYKLVNAEEKAKVHPSTFKIPPGDDREALKPGDVVKLHFMFRHMTERMWVSVTKRLDSGGYEGELRNQPISRGAKWGDRVKFKAEHVTEIQEASN
jgi:hypothetical protein